MLNVQQPNAVVSALKPGRDGTTIVRVYEATGKSTDGISLQTAASITSATEANLMEDPGSAAELRGNGITFSLRPYEIKTFRLKLSPAPKQQR